MNRLKILVLTFLPILAWVGFLISFFGLLTNWFKDALSLEGVAALLVGTLSSCIILFFGIRFFQRSNKGEMMEMTSFSVFIGVIILSFFILIMTNGGLPLVY